MEKMTTPSTGTRLVVDSLSADHSQFAARVREFAKSGNPSPFFAAVAQFPQEYNAWRARQEKTIPNR